MSKEQCESIWEIISDVWHLPNIIKTLEKAVPKDVRQVKDFEQLKKDVKDFNEFRNKLMHKLTYYSDVSITNYGVFEWCKRGLKILEDIQRIKIRIVFNKK